MPEHSPTDHAAGTLAGSSDLFDRALQGRLKIMKILGYRIFELEGKWAAIHLQLAMPPDEFVDFWDAVQSCWDHVVDHNDLYLDAGAGIHRKLYEGRSADSLKPVVVMEHLWPHNREILVFEQPAQLTPLQPFVIERRIAESAPKTT